MQAIWKFPLPITDAPEIEMPKDAAILTVQIQMGVPCIWAVVNVEAEKEIRRFRLIATGQPFNRITGRWINTFQLQSGSLVFHLFED